MATAGEDVGALRGTEGAGVPLKKVGPGVRGAAVGALASTGLPLGPGVVSSIGLGVSSATGAMVTSTGDGVATGGVVGDGVATVAGIGVERAL